MDARDKRMKDWKDRYAESTVNQLLEQAQDVWCNDPRVDCLVTELAKRLEKAINETDS